jgi:hypothetical protein
MRGGDLRRSATRRAWDNAGRTTLSPADYASALAERLQPPPPLVSTRLNRDIPPAQVAEWVGQSGSVLLRVYAKCIEDQDETVKRRIEAALRA